MNRVTLLALAGAVLAAGCIGGLGASNGGSLSPANATDSPTTQPTEPLPDRTLSLPDGPEERPDRPAELDRSSVRAYAHFSQYRYAYDSLWYSEYSDVNVECSVESVAEYRQGYNATVSCYGYSNTGGPTEDGTATELHADYPGVTSSTTSTPTRRSGRAMEAPPTAGVPWPLRWNIPRPRATRRSHGRRPRATRGNGRRLRATGPR